MAMLRSMAASEDEEDEDENPSKEASRASDSVEPQYSTEWSGGGGNVNPPKSPITPQVSPAMKQAARRDPMGMMDSDRELAMLFSDSAPQTQKVGLRPQPKVASATKSPKSLGQVTRQASSNSDDSLLSKIWEQMPDVSKF